ncbi:MAG: glycerophosphodiester phosphodiesterase [Solirubrobacteraceae bacterium]|nr:glycerophosphodiester phosphodiesterase [Solirubrobacteraceae bacterium]
MPALRRVGHKGADHIAPGNTFASFRAALEADVDMIEFDVLSENLDGTGELWLCHDYEDLHSRTPHTLEEGLAHFTDEAYANVELDVDLKLPGYEERVVEALRRHGLIDRALVSTMEIWSIDRLRALEPRLRLGLSVPKLRSNPMTRPHTALLALFGAEVVKRLAPGRVAPLLESGRIDAVMAHWRLVSPALVRTVQQHDGELYVWTVDDEPRIAALESMGVTGVITNDPRLFGPRSAPAIS